MFGKRLAYERSKLNLSVYELSRIMDITPQTQYNYESGLRSPDARYLMKLHELGVDTFYLITGKVLIEKSEHIDSKEIEIIQSYRNAPEALREAFLKVLSSY